MTTDSNSSIEHALGLMKAAWDAGDAKAYAAQFTESASYVIYVGLCYVGRSAIERVHEQVFARWQKGSRMSIKVLEVQRLDDNAAIVLTEGGVGKKEFVSRNKVQTFTMVRREGRWLCAAFQNTRRNRLLMAMAKYFS
ncbi:SgcJ/EcaC family oxidoreductase [Variovorax sp. IB41]|uniref:SgcJ/EcaC family oxidoreductase n=1 Tax=Variovorax sp. IB41 TaxID=2779370 RepID=UPI0018E818E6|nr:SgcJ/EcaC family oxidoreductase [Variovorax sp. IB41]MBJ2157546.1 SgcJ/EcaC family oxidoreductase [Variovorax sp. IB41]